MSKHLIALSYPRGFQAWRKKHYSDCITWQKRDWLEASCDCGVLHEQEEREYHQAMNRTETIPLGITEIRV